MTATWTIYAGIVALLALGALFCKAMINYGEKHGKPGGKPSE